MLRQHRVSQATYDWALADLNKKLPWGSNGLNVLLGHLAAVEADEAELHAQLAVQMEENSRLRAELAEARSTPFDSTPSPAGKEVCQ